MCINQYFMFNYSYNHNIICIDVISIILYKTVVINRGKMSPKGDMDPD